MKNLLLTLDAGTSACKAEVFTPEGESVSAGSVAYRVHSPAPGRAELDTAVLHSAAKTAVGKALTGIDTAELAGMGVSAQLGLAALDRDGRLLGTILTWADRRAVEQAKRIEATLGPEKIYAVCGRRVSPEWPLAKILYYQQYHPEQHAATAKYVSLKDYLVHQLTGAFVTDPAHASYSLIYNVGARRWETDFLSAFDLAVEQLPDVSPAHQIAGETQGAFATELGLPTGLPVIVGGPDGSTGSLGAGLVSEQTAVNIAGTTDVVFSCSSTPAFDPERGTLVNCYLIPDKWVLGGPMSTTGGCLQWFVEQFAEPEAARAAEQGLSVYELLDRRAAEIPPGSEKLLALTSLVGERTPYWEPDRRGTFFGLGPQHTKAHLYRAVMEGAAFSVRALMERLEGLEHVHQQGSDARQIILAGGGAKSRLWTQIRADVLGRPIRLPKTLEATNLGSALLTALGLAFYSDFDDAAAGMIGVEREVEPNPAHQRIYEELYGVFVELHDALRPASAQLSGVED